MIVSFQAGDVRAALRQGKPGMVAYATANNRNQSLINSDPQAAQVDTFQSTAAVAGTTYGWTYDGVVISYTAVAGDGVNDVAEGLQDDFNTNPLVRGKATAVAVTDTVTLTANWPGQAFVVSAVTAGITDTAVTTAAEADAVPFGVLMVNPSGYETEGTKYGIRAKSTSYTAQVMTITPTYVADAEVTITVIDKHTGQSIASFTAVSDTDLADLIAELVAGLNTQLPANSVLAADAASAAVTLTSEVAGLEFDAIVGVGDQGASVPTFTKVYTTGPSAATSILQSIEGVSEYAEDEEITTIGGTAASYPANAGVRALMEGVIWVENADGVSHGERVYVEMDATSDDRGQFYNADSATRLALPLDQFRWEVAGATASGDIAKLRVNTPAH